jgi:death-on-curing protein
VNWRWLSKAGVLAIHGEQLAEHGGIGGIRDEQLLESALARPVQLVSYGDPQAAELAAAYAYGIARNHPFVDGKKRAAFVAAATFLALNGWHLVASEHEVVEVILGVAAGATPQEVLARWLSDRCARHGERDTILLTIAR